MRRDLGKRRVVLEICEHCEDSADDGAPGHVHGAMTIIPDARDGNEKRAYYTVKRAKSKKTGQNVRDESASLLSFFSDIHTHDGDDEDDSFDRISSPVENMHLSRQPERQVEKASKSS